MIPLLFPRRVYLHTLAALALVACGGTSTPSAGGDVQQGPADIAEEEVTGPDATLDVTDEPEVGVADVHMDPLEEVSLPPSLCETGDFDHAGFEDAVWSVVPHIPGNLRLRGDREQGEHLTLNLRHGGPFAGAWGPGTYDLSGQSYDDCDNCVRVSSECSEGTCDAVYFISEGTLSITRWDAEQLTATLEDAVLVEVNIHNSIAVVPVVDGKRWCLDGLLIDIPLTEADAPIAQSTECVEEGTGSFVGHNVANLTLNNCNGDAVSLHDSCGVALSMWLVGTTGWCTSCGTILRSMAKARGGLLSRESVAEKTPGLDMLIVLSEDPDGDPPTPAYCLEYATSHDVDPAMVLLDHDTAGAVVSLVDPPGEPWTFEGLAQTWSHINPYLGLEPEGGVVTVFPWNALLDGSNMSYYWSDSLDRGTFYSASSDLLWADDEETEP